MTKEGKMITIHFILSLLYVITAFYTLFLILPVYDREIRINIHYVNEKYDVLYKYKQFSFDGVNND
jgi:hypothetical protein